MGVDYLICSNCRDGFPDCGSFVTCDYDAGGCGTNWCSEECAEEEGYVKCSCKLGKELNEYEGYCEEGCDKYKDKYDSCNSVDCENYTPTSCKYCRKEDFSDEQLLDKAMSLLGMNREDLIAKMKGE
ncbi:MAG: hypothetical protein ACRDD7_13950 [Peptostreptococcaceae bacterium]